MITRMSRLRMKVVRPESLLGRCWTLAARFVKTARTAGVDVALRMVRERVDRKIGRIRRGRRGSATGFLGHVIRQRTPADTFRELPWRLLGAVLRPLVRPRHFKVLLVSHSACRTGAPLCLLRLAAELSKTPGIECFVVLLKGGELADSFARVAPTLELDWLVSQGFSRHLVPRMIASAFHDFSSRGVAVCNTLAVSQFHEAFAEFHVEVLSWIHELPTFISLLGGDRSIEVIAHVQEDHGALRGGAGRAGRSVPDR